MSRREFGRIYQRGPVWYIRYSAGGKRHYESTHSTNRKDAEKLLARKEAELGIGVFVAPNVKRTTYNELAQMIRDDYAANQRRSTDRLDASLKHLSAVFGGQRAAAITADRLTRYVADRLAANAAPATIRNELNALRHAFTLAKRAGRVASAPEFPKLEADTVRQGFFETEDVEAVLRELPAALRPVVEFAWLTGWRKQEILGLTWGQVDFRSGMVRLEPGTTKNKGGREFPFSVLPRLEQLLRRQEALRGAGGQITPWVFHRRGKPIKDFYTAWASALQRAARDSRGAIVRPQLLGDDDKPARLLHDLRRTAVRNLEHAGVPRSVATKLTGHLTESVYRRYAIVARQDLQDGVAKLARLHRGTEGGQSATGTGGAS